jgi:hypothetical protein
METTIPPAEISLHPASQCDPNGRVFIWRGGLYRALTKRGAEIASKFFDSGAVASLIEKRLLIETECTDLRLEGFEMILKHRRLPLITFPMEWCSLMLQEALRLIADLQIALADYGFQLEGNDAEPWNVLFDGTAPRWIDFGSIIPIGDGGAFDKEEFLLRGVKPLALLGGNGHRIARWALQGYRPSRSVSDSDYGSLGPSPSRGGLVGRLKRRISRRPKPVGTATARDFRHWKKVIAQTRLPIAKLPANDREKTVVAALAVERFDEALLLGVRASAYIEDAARIASHVAVISESESVANAIYRKAQERKLNAQSLLMRLHDPSPGLGVANEEFAPASERLAADLVIACGLVEELVFRRWLNFDQITRTLAIFSKNRLVLEFAPMSSVSRELLMDHPATEWYSPEAFRVSLETNFRLEKETPLPASGGRLFVCAKKS